MGEASTITEEDIKRYYDLNNQKKDIEQEMRYLKKKFHEVLDDSFGKESKGEIQRGNYKVQRQIRSSIRYDDENTIQKLEDLNLNDFIVEVRRPDTEKLESAINLGLVEEKDFSDCKKSKLTQTIVVKETYSK
ncbi:hypothetical protein SAMN05216389_1071 [Oceanobacillus limi]|uniref:Uncharacterized protein n=1 Tax=Oceanobacillus limi TaxID=930131 RepID=A0A1I0CN59_9BACI|nr:hypothetical protein [Oceanobacillus limi]SET21148.1 hypothetical protein SAMN05216389_1071 [Oceanobacillus limi]